MDRREASLRNARQIATADPGARGREGARHRLRIASVSRNYHVLPKPNDSYADAQTHPQPRPPAAIPLRKRHLQFAELAGGAEPKRHYARQAAPRRLRTPAQGR